MGCGNSSEAAEKERRRLSVSKSEAAQGDGNDQRGGFTSAKESNLLDMFPDTGRRLSLQGLKAENTQKGFENKNLAKRGDDVNPTDLGIGFACKKGLKPESPNQDDFSILNVPGWGGLYGVYDGHGPYGHDVSAFVHETLPGLLVRDKDFKENPLKAFVTDYQKCHQLVEQASHKGRFDASLSGTTTTTILHRDKKLHCAHVGDSRAVLCKHVDGKGIAMDLTKDQKPDDPAEKKRILGVGGEVKKLQGDIPHRVFLKGKMYPGLAMSRSLGDLVGQSAGVSHIPEVKTYEVEENFTFFTLCSDGVWEFISSQEAVDILCKFSRSQVQQAAEALAQEAWKRWIKEEGNVVDDITVIVCYFEGKDIVSF